MSSDDLGQSRCPDAYTALAFAVGSLVGLAWVGHRLFYPYRMHTLRRP